MVAVPALKPFTPSCSSSKHSQ
jgi:hypothetical protein